MSSGVVLLTTSTVERRAQHGLQSRGRGFDSFRPCRWAVRSTLSPAKREVVGSNPTGVFGRRSSAVELLNALVTLLPIIPFVSRGSVAHLGERRFRKAEIVSFCQ